MAGMAIRELGVSSVPGWYGGFRNSLAWLLGNWLLARNQFGLLVNGGNSWVACSRSRSAFLLTSEMAFADMVVRASWAKAATSSGTPTPPAAFTVVVLAVGKRTEAIFRR